MERRIENRQLVNILALFLIVQFGGMFLLIYSFAPSQATLSVSSNIPPSQAPIFVLYLAAYIIVIALVLLLFFKFYHGNFFFRVIEAYAVGLPTFFVALFIVATALPSINIYYAVAISAIAAATLVIAKNKRPRLANLAAITASIGIGVVIGTFLDGFILAYLFMAIIALYDYIAVFITKHMQVMAKELASRNLAFLIGSSDTEIIPSRMVTKKDKKEFREKVDVKEIKDPVLKKLIKEGKLPVYSQVALGAGDLALPLVLTAGAYVSFPNTLFVPLMTVVGSMAGLVATMYLLKEYKIALPAIPPLFAFMNLFLGIAFLILQPYDYIHYLPFFGIFVLIMLVLRMTIRRIALQEQQ